uniref:acid phosphatase n=1 Tax=Timema monikensis TaxID=170555 RepID=A0A7R9HNI9_9NEOP|nr:unnamed protein product [Timema monikensis]
MYYGPLLEEMVSNMKKKSENRLIPNRKMFVYSGHDTTVANFLNTLGVFDPQCPPYDALVLIELRQNSAGKYFVSYFSSHPPVYEKDTNIFVWNCTLHSARNMVFDCCAHTHIGGGGEEGGTASSVGWSGYLSAYVADGMSSLLANTKVTDCQYIRAFSECLHTDQSTAPRVEGGYAAPTINEEETQP